MKNLLLLCMLVCICLHTNAQPTARVSIEENELTVDNYDDEFVTVSFPESQPTTVIGCPELPMKVYVFVVPVDAQVNGINVSGSNERKLTGNYNIYPAQPPASVGIDEERSGDADFKINMDIYNSNNIFPAVQAEIIADHIESGYHIVTVATYPVRYKPGTKELIISDFTFSVDYTVSPVAQRSDNLPVQSTRRAELAKQQIRSLVYNTQDIDNFAPQAKIINQSMNIQVVDTTNQIAPMSAYLHEELVPDYIIITNEELKESFRELAEWKTMKGVPTIIKTVEEIYEAYPGVDKPEQIRNYLIDCYKRWEAGLFVLIGGNISIVPARIVEKYPTDLYFQTISGNWFDSSGKEFKASISGRNLYVGRAPVKNVTDVNNFTKKVIRYEKSEGVSDKGYYKNVMASGAFMYKGDCKDYSDQDQIRYYGEMYVDMEKYINNTKAINNSLQFTFLKDDADMQGTRYAYRSGTSQCTGIKYSPPVATPELAIRGDLELSREKLFNELNKKRHHIIYHMDHSGPKALGSSSKDKSQSIPSGEFMNLQNGDYLQIMHSGSCKPANFLYEDCVGAEYMNCTTGGAVAFLAYADNGFINEYVDFERLLNVLYKNNERYDLSYIHRNAVPVTNVDRARRFQLFGDPEMQVFTDSPQQIDALVAVNLSWTNEPGKTNVLVRVSSPIPDGGLDICISKGTEFYYVGKIERPYDYNFLVDNFSGEKIVVTMTGRNCIPYIKEMSVMPSGLHYINSVEIDDTGYNGNADGRIDAGETVAMKLNLRTSMPGYKAKKATIKKTYGRNYPYTIVQGTIDYSTSVLAPKNFIVTFDKDMSFPDGLTERKKNDLNPVTFTVEIEFESGEIILDNFNVEVFKPQLEIVKVNRDGRSTSNYNEYIISSDFQNTGLGMASQIKVSITPLDNLEGYEPQLVQGNMGDLSSGQSKEFAFKFKINKALGNDPTSYLIKFEDKFGRIIEKIINPADVPNNQVAGCTAESKSNEIILKWNTIYGTNIAGYNIYRSDSPNGEFIKVNKYVNPYNYFVNYDLETTTYYYYRIAVVHTDGWEGPMSDIFTVQTSFANKGLFPVKMDISITSPSVLPVTFFDFNEDGKQEIFTGISKSKDGVTTGYIFGFKSDGTELFNLDGNTTTYSGFADFGHEVTAGVSLGKLSSYPRPQAVTLKRYDSFGTQQLLGFVNESNNEAGKPDIKFNNKTNLSSGVFEYSPVLASLNPVIANGNSQFTDILTVGWDSKINVLNADGTLRWAKQVPTTEEYTQSNIAVGNLDNTGAKYIVLGTTNGVYIYDKDGNNQIKSTIVTPPGVTPPITGLSGTINTELPPIIIRETPIFSKSGYVFRACNPIIADIDGDGVNEIIIRGSYPKYHSETGGINLRKTTIFVLDKNGDLKPGWGRNLTEVRDWNARALCVADIYGNGEMYVIEIGYGDINIYDKNGNRVVTHEIEGLISNQIPIIADMDGDNEAEVIAFAGNKIVSYKMDGSVTPGFPIELTSADANNPRLGVCDLDGTGYNDLVAAVGTSIYVWETPGRADRIEWGMARKDAQNTGQYKGTSIGIQLPGTFSAETDNSFNRNDCKLYQNTPNPVTNSTEIRYYVPCDNCQVMINIYNLQAGIIKSYTGLETDNGSITIQPGELSSGHYVYGLIVNGELIDAKKMIVE